MFIGRRIDRNGEVYYSFSYDHPQTKKRIRLKKSEHPHFTTEDEAREWALSQNAQRQARLAYLTKRESWKKTYYDFDKLFVKYESYLEEKQPRSYATYLAYFENHALAFFLGERKASNVNNWHVLFPDFRDWLKARKQKGGALLAATTKNHIIVSVNNFLAMLMERGLMDAESYRKCSLFEVGEENMKGAECVISPSEFQTIKAKLRAENKDAAEAFTVLYNTGMRLNEMLGINMAFLYPDEVSDARLTRELVKAEKEKYYGYIHLMHQPFDKHMKRKKDGSIKRAPLKGRKTISHKNARIIPIFDKDTWNILVDRYEEQAKLLKKQEWGTEEVNYLLFDGLAVSTFTAAVQKAYSGTSFEIKTPHDCRHTYATMLIGETGSPFLARLLLGHRKEAVLERYNHIYEQLSQNAQKNQRRIARAE